MPCFDEFKARALPGNTALAFHVYATPEAAFGPAIAAYGRVKGAYLPDRGLFALAASHLSDRRDVETTLRHEVLAHYGLNLFAPDVKRAILERLHASQQTPFVARIYRSVRRDYPDVADPLLVAEEVFARIAEHPPSRPLQAWDRLIGVIVHQLRRMGFWQDRVTVAEIRQTVRAIARGIHRGAPQRTFPANPQAQFHTTSSPAFQPRHPPA